jgi:branched-chain amino acid transport system substrate-binding protein
MTLAAATLVSLTGCPAAKSGPASTSTAASGDEIVIGYFGSATGDQANFGKSSKEGTQMAVDEINAAGGVKVGGKEPARKLKLVAEDDAGKAEQATNVVAKLINSDHAVAILGEVASSMSLAGGTVANEAKVPMISGSSTNPKVTEKEYVFRVCFTDDYQGQMLARFAFEKLGLKKAAILTDVKQAYSVGLTQVFKDEYTRLGGVVVAEAKYQNGDVDLKSQLTSIKSKSPDILFLPGYYNDAGTAARQSRELGMKIPLLGGDGWESPTLIKLGGAALEGSFYSNHYDAGDPDPRIQDFVKRYQAKFGTEPDSIAALAYDAALTLKQGMEKAASLDGPVLRDAIASVQGFQAVTGEISFDDHRNPGTKAIVMLEIKDGKLSVRDRVAPPKASAPMAASAAASAPMSGAAASAPAK